MYELFMLGIWAVLVFGVLDEVWREISEGRAKRRRRE